MKIGFVSTAFPQNLEKSVHGIYKRMGMFIQAMKDLGELDMLFYVYEDVPLSAMYIEEMQERLGAHWGAKLKLTLCHLATDKGVRSRWEHYVNTALSFYNRPEYSTIVGREQIFAFNNLLSRKPDMVFAHRLGAMCPIMVSGNHLPPVVFDLDDVEHVSFARSIRQPPWWWAKWLQYFQVPSLFLGERRAIQCSRRAFVCSEIDRRYLTDVWRLRNVVTIPNAIDIPGECELPKTPTLLFIGNFGYLPNIVGADYLISRVWPKIFSAIPNARLLIAGEHPENIRSFNADVPGVEFRGFVKKLDELYREVRVVCCPIFSGGGTRIKVLEAAAYGKPVVSTTLGAEGIDLLEGQEILLRDDPKGFSEACIQLLRNEDFANRIGKAAHSVVARSYNKSVIVRRIREELIY